MQVSTSGTEAYAGVIDTRADMHVSESPHAFKQASTSLAFYCTVILLASPVFVVSPPMVHLPGEPLKSVEWSNVLLWSCV